MKLSINHILPALLATAVASDSDDAKRHYVKSRQLLFDWGDVTDTFEDLGSGVADGANGLANGIIDGANGLGDGVADAFGLGSTFDDFGDALDGAIDGIDSIFDGLGDAFDGAIDGVVDFGEGAVDGVKGTVNDAVDGLEGLYGDTEGWVSGTFNDALDGTEYFFDDLQGDAFEDFGVMLYEEAKDIAIDAILYMATLISGEDKCLVKSGEIWENAKESGLSDDLVKTISKCERIRDSQGRLKYSCDPASASEFEATCSSVGGMVEYKNFQFSCGGKKHSFLNFPGCVSKKCDSQTKIDKIMEELTAAVSKDVPCEHTCAEQFVTLWSDKESDLAIARNNAIADCSLEYFCPKSTDSCVEYFCPKSTDFSNACSAAGGIVKYHNFSIECDSKRIDTIYYPDCVGSVCLMSDVEEIRRLREQSFLKAMSKNRKCSDVPDYDEKIAVGEPAKTGGTKKQKKRQQLRGVASF